MRNVGGGRGQVSFYTTKNKKKPKKRFNGPHQKKRGCPSGGTLRGPGREGGGEDVNRPSGAEKKGNFGGKTYGAAEIKCRAATSRSKKEEGGTQVIAASHKKNLLTWRQQKRKIFVDSWEGPGEGGGHHKATEVHVQNGSPGR